MVKKAKSVQSTEVVAVTDERVKMLEGFAELVSERFGYFMGRRLTQQEMTEKLKAEMKAVREKRKVIIDNIEKYLENPEEPIRTAIEGDRKQLDTMTKDLKEKRKPFQEKISPLAKAIRYMDSVVIPDSLKELGQTPTPRFKLSEWIGKAITEKPAKRE